MNKILVKYDQAEREVMERCIKHYINEHLRFSDRESKCNASFAYQLLIYFSANPSKISMQKFTKKLAYHEAAKLLTCLQFRSGDDYFEVLRIRMIMQIDKML